MSSQPYTIPYTRHGDSEKGHLSVIQDGDQIPFEVKRVYWLTDIPTGESRGNHAHIENEQVLICQKGELTIILKSQDSKTFEFNLKEGGDALYVPNMLWKEIIFNAPDSILLSLASLPYLDSDYIKDWDSFIKHDR